MIPWKACCSDKYCTVSSQVSCGMILRSSAIEPAQWFLRPGLRCSFAASAMSGQLYHENVTGAALMRTACSSSSDACWPKSWICSKYARAAGRSYTGAGCCALARRDDRVLAATDGDASAGGTWRVPRGARRRGCGSGALGMTARTCVSLPETSGGTPPVGDCTWSPRRGTLGWAVGMDARKPAALSATTLTLSAASDAVLPCRSGGRWSKATPSAGIACCHVGKSAHAKSKFLNAECAKSCSRCASSPPQTMSTTSS